MQLPFVHLGKMPGAGIPKVNWRHPISQGLVAAYFPGAFPFVPITNLAYPGSGDLTTVGSAIAHGVTAEGVGLALTTAGSNTWVGGPAPPQMQPNGRFSAFFRGMYTGNAATNTPTPIFGVSFNTNTFSTPFYSWAITPNTATAGNRFGLGYASSASAFANISTGGAPALVTNAMALGGCVILGSRSSAVAQLVYQNGIGYITNNATLDIGFYGTTPWVMMGFPAGGDNPATTLTAAYMWGQGTILSTAQMQYLDANPYALFLWPSDIIMAELVKAPVVPGTPTPSNKAIFWSPLTVGLGGAAYASRIVRRNPLVTRRRLLRPWE